MRLSRLEPGFAQLAKLRNESRLDELAGYIDDPRSTHRLRRRAASFLAGAQAGGGRAGVAGRTDSKLIPILAPLIHDRDPSVRRSAAFGLRRTGDQAAVPALLVALSDSDNATRIHAIMGLGDLKARAAVEPLSAMLRQRREAVTAARSLVEIGDERALGPLAAAAASTRSPYRRSKLEGAIVDLKRRAGLLPTP